MLRLSGIRHAWPEQAGFCLNRKYGHPDYSFVHFLTSVGSSAKSRIPKKGDCVEPVNIHTFTIDFWEIR